MRFDNAVSQTACILNTLRQKRRAGVNQLRVSFAESEKPHGGCRRNHMNEVDDAPRVLALKRECLLDDLAPAWCAVDGGDNRAELGCL